MPAASDLRARLGLLETRPAALAAVSESYTRTRNLDTTAAELGTTRRTLERCLADFPELAAAVTKIRDDARAIGWS